MSDTLLADAPTTDATTTPTETTAPDAGQPTTDPAPADGVAPDASAVVPPATDAEPEKAPEPVVYDLKLPESAALDASAVEKMTAIARASGFSNAQAQAALELMNTEVAEQKAALLAAYQPGGAEYVKQVEGWKTDTLNDVSLGKTPEERTATIQRGANVVQRYAAANPKDAPAMTEFLDSSGLGNHPAAVRFFAWLGKSAGEGSLVNGTPASATPPSAVDLFYPKGPNRTADEVAADG